MKPEPIHYDCKSPSTCQSRLHYINNDLKDRLIYMEWTAALINAEHQQRLSGREVPQTEEDQS